MLLPEYTCPYCDRSVTLVPVLDAREGGSRCDFCKNFVVQLDDGLLAIELPSGVTVRAEPTAFEVRFENWFATFGFADRALVVRVTPNKIAWSKRPLLGRLRFSAKWESFPRRHLARFDWRTFGSGKRQEETWSDLVFVSHGGAEAQAAHTFAADYDGLPVATLLQWAHDVGVPRGSEGAETFGYRASPVAERRTLAFITDTGEVVRLR